LTGRSNKGEVVVPRIDQPYTSGDWVVQAGDEDAFVAAWAAFAEWSLKNAPGAESVVLIRDSNDPRHFISFGAWTDRESVTAWRERPEFGELLGRCRALCERFEARDYTVAAAPGG
jgi:heme-degrading monooxygenase HmoA